MPLRAHNVGTHNPSSAPLHHLHRLLCALGILEFDTIFHSIAEQINFAFPPDWYFPSNRYCTSTIHSPTVRIYQQLLTFSLCESLSSLIVTPIKPHPLPASQSLTKPLAKTPMPSWALLPPAIPLLKPAGSFRWHPYSQRCWEPRPAWYRLQGPKSQMKRNNNNGHSVG